LLGLLYGKMDSVILMNVSKGRVDARMKDLELMYSSKCLMRFIVMEKGEKQKKNLNPCTFLAMFKKIRFYYLFSGTKTFLFDVYIV